MGILAGGTLDPRRMQGTLIEALAAARRRYGGSRQALIDPDNRTLSYDDVLRGAFALGNALARQTREGENVGVMLPTGIGSAVAFFALSAFGRIPAMLNFTAGLQALEDAMASAKITHLVTARRFIEVAKLEALAGQLGQCARLIYLDEVREKLTWRDKLAALIGSWFPAVLRARSDPHSPAVILFTSGTEGEPKGVVLSHANLLANIEQVRAHLVFTHADVVFNPLPVFHCFGLTVGTLTPLILGVKAAMFPTPLHPRDVVRRIRETHATILLSTDTFVSQYARTAEPEDLASLRLAVCGAERLRDETRQLVRRKFHFDLLEGYGVTEASPVVSANQPGANRPGTVGRLMTGMAYRIEAVDGITNGGRLLLKGPNVMLGYLRPGSAGAIEPVKDGWYDTGDIVAIDEDGYLAIRGRLKRFAKIGGESVSLTVVENCASAVWPDDQHAAVAIPDGRRGEQIVLVTTYGEAERGDLLTWAHNHGVPEIALPRRIVHVREIPVLGTGKTDYVTVRKLALAQMGLDA